MFELKPESYKTAFLAVLKRLSTFHEEHYLFLKNCFSVTGKLPSIRGIFYKPVRRCHVPWKYLILHKSVQDITACTCYQVLYRSVLGNGVFFGETAEGGTCWCPYAVTVAVSPATGKFFRNK